MISLDHIPLLGWDVEYLALRPETPGRVDPRLQIDLMFAPVQEPFASSETFQQVGCKREQRLAIFVIQRTNT